MADLDSVLGALRQEYQPDDDAEHRVRRALATSLAAGVVVGASKTAAGAGAAVGGADAAAGVAGAGAKVAVGNAGAATLAAGKAGLLGGWLKVIAGAGTVTALATGVVLLAPSHVSTVDAPPPAVEQRIEPAPALPAVPPPAAHEEEPSVVAIEDEEDETVTGVASHHTRPRVQPSAVERQMAPKQSPAAPEPRSTLMDELRLIRGASQAVRTGDAAAAKKALAEHRQRFPNGVLSHERRGLELLAQCDASQAASVRARAERFVAATPDSPLAQSVRARCLK